MSVTGHNMSIPIIDLAPSRIGSDEATAKTAKGLYEAFKNVGFAYVKNHGIPEDALNEAFRWSRQFFALPQSDKDKAPHPEATWHQRGYSSVGREKVSQMIFDEASITERRKVPDVKESFDMGREDDDVLFNVWLPPAVLPGFREYFVEFYETLYAAELEILKLIAIGMRLEKDFFVDYHRNKDNQIRLLHYPPVEEEILRQGRAERVAAHTDFGTITILFQDDIGGLEIEDIYEQGKFNPVPYIPGTAVVNIADLLMRWSNDELRSTMHRVVAPPLAEGEKEDDKSKGRMTKARYSMAYFCGVDKEKTVDCVPGCWGPDRPKKYEPVSATEYINMRLAAINSQGTNH
ncbi:2-oxoglutarate-dependent dioxygenase buaE [Cladobotryum mycophilum]|uniref:2-oxoglutarate-dependent dioxygenase buaE n=1 Tax=Cladobotryum mycophilum TaxID=491253 RepID=A0ABR0S5F3_9HYPO